MKILVASILFLLPFAAMAWSHGRGRGFDRGFRHHGFGGGFGLGFGGNFGMGFGDPGCCPVPAPLPVLGPPAPSLCTNNMFVEPWPSYDGCPPAPMVNFAAPMFPFAQPYQATLDPTVCDTHPLPPFFNPAPLLPPPLYDVWANLPPPPCFPHPWCMHDWDDDFFGGGEWDMGFPGHCVPGCPCLYRLWGNWCCQPDFACLSPEDKWDIAACFDPTSMPYGGMKKK